MLDNQQDAFSSVRTESVMVGQIHVFRIMIFNQKKKGHKSWRKKNLSMLLPAEMYSSSGQIF